MILIHAGFLAYEICSSRTKNVLTSGVKNILAFAFVIPTFISSDGRFIGVFQLGWRSHKVRLAFLVPPMPRLSYGVGARASSTWAPISAIKSLVFPLARLLCSLWPPSLSCRVRWSSVSKPLGLKFWALSHGSSPLLGAEMQMAGWLPSLVCMILAL